MASPSDSNSGISEDIDVDESELSAIETPAHEPCRCKSSCQTRRCPCRADKRKCASYCQCGTHNKECRNKIVIPGPRAAIVNELRETEERERKQENAQVKEFLATLDEETVRKLATRSLQRGLGSLDYINALLIAEDDEEEIDPYTYGTRGPRSSSTTPTSSTATPTSSASAPGDPHPEPQRPPPAWCKCGRCRLMPLEIENKCCGEEVCLTIGGRFRKLCADPEVLQLLIRDRADIRNDCEDNSSRSFRKAAYRAYTLDRYGHLGKGNRKVAPSCVVWAIRDSYPSSTGVYMGYKAR